MNKAQFRQFVEATNALSADHGLKVREVTDDYIDLLWNGYAKYEQENVEGDVLNDTITKETLYMVMKEVAM